MLAMGWATRGCALALGPCSDRTRELDDRLRWRCRVSPPLHRRYAPQQSAERAHHAGETVEGDVE